MGSALLLAWSCLVPAFGAARSTALTRSSRRGNAATTPKNRTITNAFALGSTALSALIATWVVLAEHRACVAAHLLQWIPTGMGHAGKFLADFSIDFAFRIDPLSCTMLLIVTWIGFLIHVYATGYMSHETGYTRFFTYLNLFMFMMLLLVLGANYMVMFVGLGRGRSLLVPADRLLLRQELRRRRRARKRSSPTASATSASSSASS